MIRRAFWIGVAQCVSWGTLFYSFGLSLPAMRAEMGAHPAVLTGAFSTALLVTAIVGFRVGKWIDRGHARQVFIGGIISGVLALIGWATSVSVWQLYLSMVLLGIGMAATLYEPAFALIERWSPDPILKNNALATVTLMGGLASPIFVPTLGYAITHFGWRWAIAGSAVPLAATALIYRRVLAIEPTVVARSAAPGVPFTRLLWWVGAAAFLSSFAGVVLSSYLPTYLTTRGFSLAVPSLIIATAGAAQVPARYLIVRVLTRWGPAPVFAVALVVQAVAVAVMVVSNVPAAFVIAGAAFGAGNGAATLLRAIGVREIVGSAGYATALGRIAAFPVVARAIAPVAAGLLSTARPAEPLWVAVAGLMACCIAGGFVIRGAREVAPVSSA